jgi:hypothetical protein
LTGRAAASRERLAIRANLMLFLCYLGRHGEATRLLPEVRALARRRGSGLDQLRVRRMEGRIAADRGRLAPAATILRQVHDRFAAQGIAYDAVLATLHLGRGPRGGGQHPRANCGSLIESLKCPNNLDNGLWSNCMMQLAHDVV